MASPVQQPKLVVHHVVAAVPLRELGHPLAVRIERSDPFYVKRRGRASRSRAIRSCRPPSARPRTGSLAPTLRSTPRRRSCKVRGYA
eukprot:1400423-Heterocapsa_arctica.AAC.1